MNTRCPGRRWCVGLVLGSLVLWIGGCESKESPSKDKESTAASDALTAEGGTAEPTAAPTFELPEADVSGLPIPLQRRIGAARTAARREPENPRKIAELGALYLVHGPPLAAISCFQRATQLEPDGFSWWHALARAYERDGKAGQAIAAYEKVLALEEKYIAEGKLPAPSVALRIRFAALLIESDRGRAESLFREVIEVKANEPAAHYGLGRCALAAGQKDEALQHYRKAVEVRADYVPVRSALVELLEEMGQAEEAAEHRAKATAEDRILPVVDVHEMNLMRQGFNLEVLVSDAGVLAQRGDFARAEQALRGAADVDAKGVLSRHSLGLLRVMEGKPEEAATAFRDVLERDPEFTPAKIGLARALGLLEQSEEAEQLLRDVLEAEPTHIGALRQFCTLMAAVDTPDKALPICTNVLEAAPDDAVVHYQVGDFLFGIGLEDDGLKAAQRAVEMDPELTAARYTLSVLLTRHRDFEDARVHAEEALRQVPSFLAARLVLIDLLFGARDFPALIQCCREGLEYAPNTPRLLNALAWTLATCPVADLRNPEEAVELADKAAKMANYSDDGVLDTLAAAYAAAGRFDEARQRIAEAIQMAQAAKQPLAVRKYLARQTLYEADKPYYEGE